MDLDDLEATIQAGDYVSREVKGSVIDLSIGQPSPELLPMGAIAQAAAHRLTEANTLLLQYGPRQGYASFRAALASFLTRRYGVQVAADHLLITSGVSHGLDLACGVLARPGDVILTECPTYFLVPPIFRDNHLTVLPVPTDSNGLDTEALAAWLAANPDRRPRLLYTVPAHSNPRGATLPPARRRRLLQLAHEYGFHVLADEVYQLLSFPEGTGPAAVSGGPPAQPQAQPQPLLGPKPGAGPGQAPPPPGVPPQPPQPLQPQPQPLPLPLRAYEAGLCADPRDSRVLSFGSFSKMLAPGLRLGWIEAAPPLLARLVANGSLSSGGCPAGVGAGLAHSALELGLQDAHLDGVVRPRLAARAAALCAGLAAHLPPGCRWGVPAGGYFVWVELPEEAEAAQLLAEASAPSAPAGAVRFVPGPACGGGPAHALRLSFALYPEAALAEGAARLGAAVRAHLAAAAARRGAPAEGR